MDKALKEATDSQFEAQETQDIVEKVSPMYLKVKVLEDGSVAALTELFTTRAILLGVGLYGWHRRFCFADRGLADQRFDELKSEEDIPEGYTARRGL